MNSLNIDMIVMGKIIGCFGLFLNIISALCLWKYFFQKPEPLLEQRSLPSKHYTEEKNGHTTQVLEVGVSICSRNYMVNKYNDYKDRLYATRINFGLSLLVVGFFLQACGLFFDETEDYPLLCGGIALLTSATAVWFVFQLIRKFVWVKDIAPLGAYSGNNMTFSIDASGKGFSIETDDAFRDFSKQVAKYRQRIGLD